MSTTVPSKRNKHEANEPKSVQWEPEISGESGSVGSSNHELREPGLEPDSVRGDLEPNQEGTSARSADVGPSEPFRYVISYNTTLLRGNRLWGPWDWSGNPSIEYS